MSRRRPDTNMRARCARSTSSRESARTSRSGRASRLTKLEANGLSRAHDPRRAPRSGRARSRSGDRAPRRPGARAGRHRDDGDDAVRALRRRACPGRHRGGVRRSQHPPDRLQEPGRSPVSAGDGRQVRRLVVAVCMAGHPFELPCPKLVGVFLENELARPWIQAKDVILELLRRRGVRGGRGCVFEFTGPGVHTLSYTERGTIANMIAELGATGAVFPADDETRAWLEEQERLEDFTELPTGDTGDFDDEEQIDLAELVPLVAKPSSPGNVVPVDELVGTPIQQVCIGSSVNSSYHDLALCGAVMRGQRLSEELVSATATPGSRQILDQITRSGTYVDLLMAGVRMLEPA